MIMYYVALATAVMGGLFVLLFPSFPPEIPIFVSAPWGESQLASPWTLLIPIVLMDLFYLAMRFIQYRHFRGDPYLSRIISGTLYLYVTVTLIVYLRLIVLIT